MATFHTPETDPTIPARLPDLLDAGGRSEDGLTQLWKIQADGHAQFFSGLFTDLLRIEVDELDERETGLQLRGNSPREWGSNQRVLSFLSSEDEILAAMHVNPRGFSFWAFHGDDSVTGGGSPTPRNASGIGVCDKAPSNYDIPAEGFDWTSWCHVQIEYRGLLGKLPDLPFSAVWMMSLEGIPGYRSTFTIGNVLQVSDGTEDMFGITPGLNEDPAPGAQIDMSEIGVFRFKSGADLLSTGDAAHVTVEVWRRDDQEDPIFRARTQDGTDDLFSVHSDGTLEVHDPGAGLILPAGGVRYRYTALPGGALSVEELV